MPGNSVNRWVHKRLSTGTYATMRSYGLAYDGSLQEAKVYRNRNGGRYFGHRSEAEQADYEWVPVYLTTEKPA